MKNLLTNLIIGIVISLSVLFLVYRPRISLNAKSLSRLAEVSPTAIPTSYPTATPIPSVAATPSPVSKTTTTVDLNALKQAYALKHNVPVSSVNLKLSESNGVVAHGFVGSGHWWLGARSGGKWVLVQDGFGYVSCEAIASYHFPQSMIPICVNRVGRLITL